MKDSNKTKAISLLGHQGTPSLKEVIGFAKENELEVVVLTSKPSMESLIKPAQELAYFVHIVNQNSLVLDDVKNFENLLKERNVELLGAIATWEGYRPLMCYLNNRVNAADCSYDAISKCLDKYKMRTILNANGLSSVHVEEFSLEDLTTAFEYYKGKFIKPRSGAASFACFRLKEENQLMLLKKFRDEMQNDPVMSSIFCGNFDFMVEEYMPGSEFSVEIIVLDGQVYTLAIHEKYGLDYKEFTILESVVISPPVSVDTNVQSRLIKHVSQSAQALGINNGVFHVEVKYDDATQRIEIIEFNPRIGGFLISDSVKVHTNGKCLVNMWLSSLIFRAQQREELKFYLSSVNDKVVSKTSVSTIQLSQFGERGRTIAEIGIMACEPKPTVTKCYVEAGSVLVEAEREIPIFDAMWSFDYLITSDEIDAIVALGNEKFKLEYAN